MRRLCFLIGLIFVVSMTVGAKGKAPAVTGSFFVDGSYSTPTAGLQMRFYTQTSPFSQCCGGDSVLAWVDVKCVANGVQVLSIIEAANSPVIPGIVSFQNYAYVDLDSETWALTGYPGGTCTSFLFWDGAHRPTRSRGNTLAGPLTFVVSGGL